MGRSDELGSSACRAYDGDNNGSNDRKKYRHDRVWWIPKGERGNPSDASISPIYIGRDPPAVAILDPGSESLGGWKRLVQDTVVIMMRFFCTTLLP